MSGVIRGTVQLAPERDLSPVYATGGGGREENKKLQSHVEILVCPRSEGHLSWKRVFAIGSSHFIGYVSSS
jgi:hypothetical protein